MCLSWDKTFDFDCLMGKACSKKVGEKKVAIFFLPKLPGMLIRVQLPLR